MNVDRWARWAGKVGPLLRGRAIAIAVGALAIALQALPRAARAEATEEMEMLHWRAL